MRSQKNCVRGLVIISIILLTVLHSEVCADSQEKQWIVLQEQIPKNSVRYNIALRYSKSESSFYNASQPNIKSTPLPEAEQIGGYKELFSFGPAVDGFQYSVLIRGADEFTLLSADGRQIRKARVLRSKQNVEPQVLREGYLFLGSQFEIPFELPCRQLGLDVNEPLMGMFTINIYGEGSGSYRGSFSTIVRGLLTGSVLIKGASLEVSVSYRESLLPNDRYVNLTVKPLDEQIQGDSAGGKITDVIKLRSAKLVVEKIASDNSELALAVIDGDIKQTLEGGQFPLGLGKSVPAFARVDLIRHKPFTLEELCKKAGPQRHIVMIFGDFRQRLPNYYYRGQPSGDLPLDETMILDLLQRDLKYPPLVVFVCRRFSITDLYEKWLGKDPDFYIITDYSNPMSTQFDVFSRDYPPYPRQPVVKEETLRKQLMLPEDNVLLLLVSKEGKLVYIDIDAGQQLSEKLTKINRLLSSKKK